MRRVLLVPVVLMLGGCEWGIPALEPERVPFVGVQAEFRTLTGDNLGAAHGYVVGISEEHRASGDVGAAIESSLRGETLPSTRPADRVGDGSLRARSEAVAESAMEADRSRGIGNPKVTGGPTQLDQPDRMRPSLRPIPASAPATAPTADLNDDGFITLDEIVAIHRAGVSSAEIAQRLNATGYRLGATRTQLDQLRAFGVDDAAITPLKTAATSSRPPRAEVEMR